MTHLYGILLSLGILCATLVAEKLVQKTGKDSATLWGLVFWVILAGVIGARVYHVLDLAKFYFQHPGLIFAFYRGGLGIIGGIIGGLAGGWLYLKAKNDRAAEWFDIVAVVTPLAQAIGRWGNYVNQEVYGLPTTLPWAITVEGKRYHPLFLYESLLDLALFGLLVILYTKKPGKFSPGEFLLLYLMGYGLIRFGLEFLRLGNQWVIAGLNVPQMLSILVITYGIIHFIRSRRLRA